LTQPRRRRQKVASSCETKACNSVILSFDKLILQCICLYRSTNYSAFVYTGRQTIYDLFEINTYSDTATICIISSEYI
jgi:hypothetical protein